MEKTRHEHNILKFFMPLLAIVYMMTLAVIYASPLGEEFSLSDNMLSLLLEAAALIITCLLAFKLLPKIYPQMKTFSPKRPNLLIVIGIILLTPAEFVLSQQIIRGLSELGGPVVFEQVTCSSSELKETIVESISAVV